MNMNRPVDILILNSQLRFAPRKVVVPLLKVVSKYPMILNLII
jgi:hypothetical protein